MSEKRNRGGQPGNQNAFKHGYYSAAFKKSDRVDFDLAAGVEGFSEEIALIRFKIKQAVTKGNTRQLMPLVKAAGALEKLIKTDYKINGGSRNLANGLRNIMREMMIPIGGEAMSFEAIKNWCGYTEEDDPHGVYKHWKDLRTNHSQPKASLNQNENPKTESV